VPQHTVVAATPSKDARGLVAIGFQCDCMVFSASNVLDPDIFGERNNLGRSAVAVKNFRWRVAKGTALRKDVTVGKTNLTSRDKVLSSFTVSQLSIFRRTCGIKAAFRTECRRKVFATRNLVVLKERTWRV
jgi:hypothetical protein